MKWLPKIISLLVLWGVLAYMVIVIDPVEIRDIGIEGAYLPFFILVFFTIFYTATIVLQSWIRALGITLLVVFCLAVSMLRLMSWFLFAIAIALLLFILLFGRDGGR